MLILNAKHPVELSGFEPGRCLVAPDDAHSARDERGYLVKIGGKAYFLPESYVLRADSYGVQRLYRAAMSLRAHFKYDAAVLSGCGFTEGWSKSYGKSTEAMYALWQGKQKALAQADLDRQLSQSPISEADGLLREALMLAKSGGLGWAIDIPHGDRQALSDKEQALGQFNARAAHPQVRTRLLSCGVTKKTLSRLAELEKVVHQEIGARAEEIARLAQDSLPLRLAKAVILGDLLILSTVTRACMPETRWGSYQVSTLLEIPEREARPEQPQPEPAQPGTGTPTPTPPVVAGPSSPPAPAAMPLPPASGAAAFRNLQPGTVIFSMPVKGGPALNATVQDDGTWAWAPASPSAPVPATPPLPAATPKPEATDRPKETKRLAKAQPAAPRKGRARRR